jgi:hypothetical protein
MNHWVIESMAILSIRRGNMRHRTTISCFKLLTLLFVQFIALPAFANYNLYVTVNAGGTSSYVVSEKVGDLTCGGGSTQCSLLNCNYDNSLGAMAICGVDANGNYDGAFTGWSGCPQPSGNQCYIPVDQTGNLYVTATFAKVYGQSSNIGVTVSGTGKGNVAAKDTCGYVWINCGGGNNVCSAQINSGSSSYIGLNATPDPSSHFVGWSSCPSPNGAICQVPAGQSANVTSTFAINTYTVTPTADANGSISPNTPQTVAYDGTTSFTVTPNAGYGTASVTGCGGTLSGNVYSTGAIRGNCTVTAAFAPLYNVTSSAGANGSISPSNATVISGSSVTLTITPASGYTLASLTDNGVAVIPTVASGNYIYTLSNITTNHCIQATFGSLFTINSSVVSQGGGSIAPVSTTANYGGSVTLTFTSQSGYKLTQVTDNGVGVSDLVQWRGGTQYTYTLNNITSNHNIQAAFEVGTPGPIVVPALSIPAIIFIIVLGGVFLWIRKKRIKLTKYY